MSENEKHELERSEKNPGSPRSEDQEEYRFLDQKIKKRPVRRKTVILRILGILLSGIAIGLIAALVFSLVHPEVLQIVNMGGEAKITIPADEEPEATVLTESETEQDTSEEIETDSYEDSSSELSGSEGMSSAETDTLNQHQEKDSDRPETKSETGSSSDVEGTEEAAPIKEEPFKVETQKGSSVETAAAEVQEEPSEKEGTTVEQKESPSEEDVTEPEGITGERTAEESEKAPADEGAAEQDETASETEVSDEQKESSTDKTASVEQENPAEGGTLTEEEAVPDAVKDTQQEMTDTPDETAETDTDTQTAEDVQEEKPAITLKEYRQLYQDILEVADKAERAVVQVIGITNEMDYFNQNYENQRRISGLVVAMNSTDLFVLTEYRVVDQSERIQVVFNNGSMTDANLQRFDPNTGLAILKVQLASINPATRNKLEAAPLGNSYKLLRGEPILAMGSPIGYSDSIAYGVITSTSSKASAVDMEYNLLMTDIDGSTDGSGVLVNLDGSVVGIITHAFTNEYNNCVTAIPISQLKELIQDLSNNEPQNYVGIRGQDVTQDITDRTGIPRGVLVTDVEPNSPAMLAGIKEFDVLVKIGEEQPIETMRDYHRQLDNLEPEDTVSVTALRKGARGYSEITFEVTIEGR